LITSADQTDETLCTCSSSKHVFWAKIFTQNSLYKCGLHNNLPLESIYTC